MNIREAAEKWVQTLNAIDENMIAELMRYNPEDWSEVTPPTIGQEVYVYCQGKGTIVDYDKENDLYPIEMSDGYVQNLDTSDFEVDNYYDLPMWGTMWSFSESIDNWWLDEQDGLRKMSECGFRIYASAQYGYFFGIDGAGYDFYESHWIPLYKARGLHWHNEE